MGRPRLYTPAQQKERQKISSREYRRTKALKAFVDSVEKKEPKLIGGVIKYVKVE